jgi:hypothetical protein
MPLINAEQKLLRLGRQAQVVLSDALEQGICAAICTCSGQPQQPPFLKKKDRARVLTSSQQRKKKNSTSSLALGSQP